MAQLPTKRILTRWGYLRDAFRKLAAFTWLSGCLFSWDLGASNGFQWQLVPAFFLGIFYVSFLLASSVVNFRRWAELRQTDMRWTTGETGRESSGFSTFFLTGLATFLTALSSSMLFSPVNHVLSPIFVFGMMTGPLMWMALAFEGKHQRERYAIERTMNQLAQTLANVAGEKAKRESAAQRGTNATIGGVARRASWSHWWTDAGTRDEVEQKQENRRG